MLITANSQTHADTYTLSASSSGSCEKRETVLLMLVGKVVVMKHAHFLISEVINVLIAVINHVVQHR